MQKEQKQLLGKILGEVYKMHDRRGLHYPASKATIYGLTHGMETIIDDELDRIGWVSSEAMQAIMAIFASISDNPTKLAAFEGYADISDRLAAAKISKETLITVVKYMQADFMYPEMVHRILYEIAPELVNGRREW